MGDVPLEQTGLRSKKWIYIHYLVLLIMCFFLLSPIFIMFQTQHVAQFMLHDRQ